MRLCFLLRSLLASTLLAASAPTNLPRATSGPAANKEDPRLELVATFEAPPAGVAISHDGRIFISFPRWGDSHDASLAEFVNRNLVPFPSAEAHTKKAGDAQLQSIQGIAIIDNTIYFLDAATAKLHIHDLTTRALIKRIHLPTAGIQGNIYANDLCIDPHRGTQGFAYISDSVTGGIIVLDIASSTAWRRLAHHPSTHPDKNFIATVEDELLGTPTTEGKKSPMLGNTDGIALSPDHKTLYYNAFSSHHLYSIPTHALANKDLPEDQIAQQVKDLTTKPSANDGMNTDDQGRVYTTDYESCAIRRFNPAIPDVAPEIFVQDSRLLWPDAVFAHAGYLYITTNQLNRMPSLHQGKDLRQKPYALFRHPLDSSTTQPAPTSSADEQAADLAKQFADRLKRSRYMEQGQPRDVTLPTWKGFPTKRYTYTIKDKDGATKSADVIMLNPTADQIARWIVDALTEVKGTYTPKAGAKIFTHILAQSGGQFPVTGIVYEDILPADGKYETFCFRDGVTAQIEGVPHRGTEPLTPAQIENSITGKITRIYTYARIQSTSPQQWIAAGHSPEILDTNNKPTQKWLDEVRTAYQKAWTSPRNDLLVAWLKAQSQ
jgi:sugar lactone lactonase YvrE